MWPDVTFADGVLDAVAAVHLGKFYRNGDLWSVETCQYLFRNQLIERCGGWKGSERYNSKSESPFLREYVLMRFEPARLRHGAMAALSCWA